MIAGYKPVFSLPAPGSAASGRRHSAVFAFGVSYAIASLSCTLPVFLAVAAGSSVQTGVLASIGTVLAYGVGMSMLLVVLTIAVALGRTTLVRRVRSSAGWLKTVSGVVAIAAGVVLVWYWAVNLALANGAGAGSGVFPFVERTSATLSNWLADRPGTIGIVLAAVLAAAIIGVVVGRARLQRDPAAPSGQILPSGRKVR